MRRILTSLVLVVFLFPSLALGETVIRWRDLVQREGVHYKKFTDVPFSGKVTGRTQGKLKNGKKYGPWAAYWLNGQLKYKGTYKDGKKGGLWVGHYDNGQLSSKGTYKDGKREGPWVNFNQDGTVKKKHTGTYKDGKRAK